MLTRPSIRPQSPANEIERQTIAATATKQILKFSILAVLFLTAVVCCFTANYVNHTVDSSVNRALLISNYFSDKLEFNEQCAIEYAIIGTESDRCGERLRCFLKKCKGKQGYRCKDDSDCAGIKNLCYDRQCREGGLLNAPCGWMGEKCALGFECTKGLCKGAVSTLCANNDECYSGNCDSDSCEREGFGAECGGGCFGCGGPYCKYGLRCARSISGDLKCYRSDGEPCREPRGERGRDSKCVTEVCSRSYAGDFQCGQYAVSTGGGAGFGGDGPLDFSR